MERLLELLNWRNNYEETVPTMIPALAFFKEIIK